jgi:hypothetical protein
MQKLLFLAVVIMLGVFRISRADPTYSFHEKLHVGQKVSIAETYDCKNNYAWTTNGVSTPTNSEDSYQWKVALTIQQVKDGSDVQATADVDPSSYSAKKEAGQDEKRTACPFIGKSVRLTRLADESFTNDYHGDASTQDANIINNFLSPDEDYYPDKPVAVGDVWDNSVKLSKHALLGPNDQLLSECRLDWVKTIDGKPMAQISNSVAIVYHEDDNVEEAVEETATILVDMNSQMIVKADQKGTSKYTNPAGDASQISGGTEFVCHDEVISNPQEAATNP